MLGAGFGAAFLAVRRADLVHGIGENDLRRFQVRHLNACLLVRAPIPHDNFFRGAGFLRFRLSGDLKIGLVLLGDDLQRDFLLFYGRFEKFIEAVGHGSDKHLGIRRDDLPGLLARSMLEREQREQEYQGDEGFALHEAPQ